MLNWKSKNKAQLAKRLLQKEPAGSLGLVAGGAGSHISADYCLQSHFIMQSCLWRGEGWTSHVCLQALHNGASLSLRIAEKL